MRISTRGVALAGTLLLALGSRSVPAHHTYAKFDGDQRVSVTATVTSFGWHNPHVIIWIDVPRQGGGGHTPYALASDSINSLQRRGWKRNSLRRGDVIAAEFYRLRDGRNGGFLIKLRLPDGSELGSIPLSVGAIEAAANARSSSMSASGDAR